MKNSNLLFALLITVLSGFAYRIQAQICTPFILGTGYYDVCCTLPLTYTVASFSGCPTTGAIYTWTVTGGQVSSGQGTPTVGVSPNPGSNLLVTCKVTVGSITSMPGSISTVWTGSQTPPISAPDYFCKNEIYTICVPASCGMTGVDWTLPPNLDLVSTVSPFCIRVMPATSAPIGSGGVITAQATTTAGCTLSASAPKSFTIYEAETPPAPSGYITLDLDSGDPCDDPVYVVNFHTTHPYRNGYTSVSPGIVLGGNHPIGHGGHGEPSEPITITVCNVNLCSGKKSCITFEVDPPQPCFGKEAGQTDIEEPGTSIVAAVNFQEDEAVSVFPNPSDGRFYLSCPANTAGELAVFDSAGRQVTARNFESWNLSDSITGSPLPRGVYFIRIRMAGELITKKLVVQ